MPTINKLFGVSDPQYDALRVQSNQAIWPDAGGAPVGGAGGVENKIYVWHADGSTVDLFAPDATGLGLALAAAASGDVVWIPAVNITFASATVPTGIEVIGIGREKTILSGALTAGGSCVISHLSVILSANSAGEIDAITGPSAGTLDLYDCNVQGNNANGTGYALKSIDDGVIVHRFCVFSAQSGGADSNPFSSTGGSHTELVEISTGAITVTADAGVTISGLTIGQDYAVEAFNGPWLRGGGYDAEYTYRVSNNGGTTWLPSPGGYYLGRDFNGNMHLDLPAWVTSAEVVNTNYARIYFTATTTSIKIRVGEDGYWPDNSGSLSWRLWGNAVVGGAIIEGYASDIQNLAGLTSHISRYGDRAVYDALNYQIRHANDIGMTEGIHHTIDELDLRYGQSQLPWLIPSPDGGTGTEADPYTDSVDNAAGIQTALNTLAAARNGHVLLEAKRYDVTATNGIRLSTPQIKMSSVEMGGNTDPNGEAPGINNSKIYCTSDGLHLGATSGPRPSGITLEDLYIYGAITGDKNGIHLDYSCDGPKIKNVFVGGNWTRSIFVSAQMDGALWWDVGTLGGVDGFIFSSGADCLHSVYDRCYAADMDRYGWYGDPAGQGRTLNRWVRMTNCLFLRCARDGTISSDPANVLWTFDEGVIANNEFADAGHDLIGNTTVANVDGLIVVSDYTVISNNQFVLNSGYGLRVRGDYNIIIGNSFLSNTDGNIIIEAGATGNIIVQPGLANITDNGTGTIYVGTVTSIATGTGLTGGPITGIGTISDANTGVAAATYGDESDIPQIAINAQGRITSASNIAISTFTPVNVYNETQTADGTSLIYYLVNYAAPGTIRSYIDGIRQPISDDDDPTDMVTFSSAPGAGALLLFDYELDI